MKRKYERLGDRYSRLIVFLVTLAVVVAAVVWFLVRRPLYPRVTVVIATNPVVVWSWEKGSGRFTAVTIPADVVIEAAYGYGVYSLASLWRLGAIEKKSGVILATSIEEALALPVPWYVGRPNDMLDPETEPVAAARSIFSLRGLVARIWGAYETNIPLLDYFFLTKATLFTRPDRVTLIDAGSLTQEQVLPDNSKITVLDLKRVDSRLAPVFEDPRIRQEALRIAVYNTTRTPGIAQRVGRVLGNIGALVVALDTREEPLTGCRLQGSKAALASFTAQFIQGQYDCEISSAPPDVRADLTVSIGRDYQKRLVPN